MPTKGATGKTGRDRALEAGSSAHYEDPAYYTKTYRHRLDDVRYYVELAATRGGSVLEYGCGNGRITIPLARAGVEVVGVDLSRPMLDDLKVRLKSEPPEVAARVQTRLGDMRALRLRRRFSRLIVPFNAFLHLYTRQDVERFLARARAHLAPRAELVFDVSIPEPTELARDPNKPHFAPRFIYPDAQGGQLVRYSERFDYDRLRQVLHVAMEFHPTKRGEGWMTPLAHRQFFPQELEALLHYNGFTITEQHGDFFGHPPTGGSQTLVIHARSRKP